MRLSRSLGALAAAGLALALSAGSIARPATADEAPAARATTTPTTTPPDEPAARAPTFADLKARLDGTDHLAVLEALHVGLTELADGSTYLWHRKNGRISGSVRPTMSFRDEAGKVCRYVVFQITLGEYMRQIEGIACRQADRSWVVAG
jgi:hypothetical protein